MTIFMIKKTCGTALYSKTCDPDALATQGVAGWCVVVYIVTIVARGNGLLTKFGMPLLVLNF